MIHEALQSGVINLNRVIEDRLGLLLCDTASAADVVNPDDNVLVLNGDGDVVLVGHVWKEASVARRTKRKGTEQTVTDVPVCQVRPRAPGVTEMPGLARLLIVLTPIGVILTSERSYISHSPSRPHLFVVTMQ